MGHEQNHLLYFIGEENNERMIAYNKFAVMYVDLE
jgi:hypothetical protein